jgi:hypothetical protein
MAAPTDVPLHGGYTRFELELEVCIFCLSCFADD